MSLDWLDSAAIATICVAITVIGALINKTIRGWARANRLAEKQSEQINVALFGREEDGALPRVNGLIYDNKKTMRCLGSLMTTTQRQDIKTAAIASQVNKIVDRTQSDDGTSIKDQLTRIDERYVQLDRIEASGDRGEASRDRTEASGARVEEHLNKNDPDIETKSS
jgi:hypothetical protein